MKNVCIIGAGAIGSLYAAHLASICSVSVLTRRKEQADTLNQDGLRISGKHDLIAAVRASQDPAELGDFDLCIVATKATQLEAAAQAIAGRSPSALVMTVQNGLGAEEIVGRHGDWKIISAVTFMSGRRHGDAHVEYELDTATWMGPYAGTGTTFEDVQHVGRLLVESGLAAKAFPDLLPAQWSKLIFNATVNTVSALTGLGHIALFAKEDGPTDLGHLVHDLMDEGKRIASGARIELYEDPWEMNVLAVQRGETQKSDYAHLPSMLEDVNQKQTTEVDFITGALVREAQRVGEPAPLHSAMYRLIKGKEASW